MTAAMDLYLRCLYGESPAEELPPELADALLLHLHAQGWDDHKIARHTKWTAYTVARKRFRLRLRANPKGTKE